MSVSFQTIKNAGNQILDLAKDLVTKKPYQKFKEISIGQKIDVIAQTALVAFAAGILGSCLAFSFAVTAVVVGAFSFAGFTNRAILGEHGVVTDLIRVLLTKNA